MKKRWDKEKRSWQRKESRLFRPVGVSGKSGGVSPKQYKLARLVVERGHELTMGEIGELAGYKSGRWCADNAATAMKRPAVRAEIIRLLEAQEGTKLKDLTGHLRTVLEAQQEKVTQKGEIIRHTDLNIRARGVELLGRLYGAFAPEESFQTTAIITEDLKKIRYQQMAKIFASWDGQTVVQTNQDGVSGAIDGEGGSGQGQEDPDVP